MLKSLATRALIALVLLSTSQVSAAQAPLVQNRVISLRNPQGEPIDGLRVAFKRGSKLAPAIELPNHTFAVRTSEPKLLLEVEVPGLPANQLEMDLTGFEARRVHLLVDENSGALKLRGDAARRLDKAGRQRAGAPQFASSQPINDDCANASLALDSGTYLLTTFGATTDGFPEPSCGFGFHDQLVNDVWFRWVANCTGTVTVSDCGNAPSDSRVAIYAATDCPDETTDPIACGDDECGTMGLNFRATFQALEGEEFLIRIGNFESDSPIHPPVFGFFTITCEPTPPNDDCENATPLSVPSSVVSETTHAALEEDLSFCGTVINSPGVWYEVVGTGEIMFATTCGLTTNFDTKLSVFCRSCGPDLTCVAGNDDSDGPCGSAAAVQWCSEAGAVYRILVHGSVGQTGEFGLFVNSESIPCEPAVLCRYQGAVCDESGCEVLFESDVQAGDFLGDQTDCCGSGLYIAQNLDHSLEDIYPTGADVSQGGEIDLGFGFDYFGEQFFTVGVNQDGFCSFDGFLQSGSSITPLPDQDQPNGVAAPYWASWDLSLGGRISYETRGTPGSRRCIVQWTHVAHVTHGGANTFQVLFYEGSNEIQFRYSDSTSNCVGPMFGYSIGIENTAGTHGYGAPNFVPPPAPPIPVECDSVSRCIAFVPRRAPLCDDDGPLVLSQEVKFSQLDGGPYDLDGLDNGVFKTNSLTISTLVLADAPHATFEVLGDLVINGGIFHDDTMLVPDIGPSLTFKVCESMSVIQTGLVRSFGRESAGAIKICVGEDFRTVGPAGIETRAVALEGGDGGSVSITAGGKVELGYQGFIKTSARQAGEVTLSACSGAPDAIDIRGSINAAGIGAEGRGAYVTLDARQGGMLVTGGTPIFAEGQANDGVIQMVTAATVSPEFGPFTLPPAVIQENFLTTTPCSCSNE